MDSGNLIEMMNTQEQVIFTDSHTLQSQTIHPTRYLMGGSIFFSSDHSVASHY